ncbi:MAG: radical SAM protein, partial [Candidatus Altiarchaeota archaeon]|nr:radical SAM protein [Candidatus Altiarchaeota archaeon]
TESNALCCIALKSGRLRAFMHSGLKRPEYNGLMVHVHGLHGNPLYPAAFVMKEQVRISMGTLKVLGMELLQSDADPTTAYLQTYHPGKCGANCSFCAQARDSDSRSENIARGFYPPRDTLEVFERLARAYEKNLLKRACIQTMNYPGMLPDLLYLIGELKKRSEIPVSVSVYPLPPERFRELKESGADNIVIPLDAMTPGIFEEIKGKKAGCPYRWETHMKALEDAVGIFGKGNTGTHLIIGLGETEEQTANLLQELTDLGVYPALFAYTPVPKTRLKKDPPRIGHYRRIQLLAHLITRNMSSFDIMRFRDGIVADYGIDADSIKSVISSGEPFRTKGCEGCDRPYSTEQPGGLMYNYPRELTPAEIERAIAELKEGLCPP